MPVPPGTIELRLPVRSPFAATALLTFLAARAVSGVELVHGRTYTRTLRLPAGSGVARLTFPQDSVDPATRAAVDISLTLAHPADLAPAVDRCRRLLDADADPVAIDAALSADPALAGMARSMPGLRLPGAVDGPEIVIRALLGQQISVAAARTGIAKLAVLTNEQLPFEDPDVTLLFPSASAIAALGTSAIAGPRARADTIVATAAVMASGELRVDAGRRTADLTAELVARKGIGPWTAGYVAMRVLGDPDVLLTGDLIMRQGAAALGLPATPRELGSYGAGWSPFRSYAGLHLWRAAPVRRPAVITALRPAKSGSSYG
ncbi:MAG: DNA-3-methyladenine glycosylase 2 family protein [Actinomycetota bacterium]|nr:DNA-3-methyladenine glycosylase 2 family protein [Actinomycetota bacterium]